MPKSHIPIDRAESTRFPRLYFSLHPTTLSPVNWRRDLVEKSRRLTQPHCTHEHASLRTKSRHSTNYIIYDTNMPWKTHATPWSSYYYACKMCARKIQAIYKCLYIHIESGLVFQFLTLSGVNHSGRRGPIYIYYIPAGVVAEFLQGNHPFYATIKKWFLFREVSYMAG